MLDINPAPINYLIIDGTLYLDDTRDIAISAKSIFIRAGNFSAGSPQTPFKHKLTITLTSKSEDDGWYIDALIFGNKYIVVTGSLNLYGVYPAVVQTDLIKSAFSG